MEIMTRFNENFINFLLSKKEEDWKRLLEIIHPDAFIETCMEVSYRMSMDQFHKWMIFLTKYYVEVALINTTIIGDSESSVKTEFLYSTVIHDGTKGSDKWVMLAGMDKTKGHFVVDSLHMVSECKTIPKQPPLEPAIPAETFVANLRTKLMSDIFLSEAIRDKSSYETMYHFMREKTVINACDVGEMNTKQFVEYWYKRYGKTTYYTNHTIEVKKEGNDYIIDFAVTFRGQQAGTFFRDRYMIKVHKYRNLLVEFFENFMDWTIYSIKQFCTENKTIMSKGDGALVTMSLAARRWEQVYNPKIQWDRYEAFLEMFEKKTFTGFVCGGTTLGPFSVLQKWIRRQSIEFIRSRPKMTKIYNVENNRIGFFVLSELTTKENKTHDFKVHFEGFRKDDQWQLNHLGLCKP